MERAHYAAELFLEGYNCAQAVCIAFCDLTGFTKEQIVDLKEVNDAVEEIFSCINSMLRNRDFSDMSVILEKRDRLFDKIDDIIKSQLRRMRVEHMSTSASILFFNILNETKTMVLQSRNIMKSLEHFVED